MDNKGLVIGAFSGWQSGDCKPVLEIDFRPDKVADRYRLLFVRERDELGWVWLAHYLEPMIGPVVMRYYESGPVIGMVCYADSKVDNQAAIVSIINSLELKGAEILWMQS